MPPPAPAELNASSLTINNGTAQLGASNALGGSALTNITVNATTAGTTALLDLNGFNQSMFSLTFGGMGDTADLDEQRQHRRGHPHPRRQCGLHCHEQSASAPPSPAISISGGATRTFAIADSTSAHR